MLVFRVRYMCIIRIAGLILLIRVEPIIEVRIHTAGKTGSNHEDDEEGLYERPYKKIEYIFVGK